MAEADWGSVQAPEVNPQAGQSASIVNLAGALMSLALVVGLGVWGYKLAVRDVSGVPVVRALEGPMRVQPDDPGGQAAAHQGLAVNNVQAEGQAEAPADRLALAPRPVELTDEDRPIEPTTHVQAPVVDVTPAPADVAAATAQAIEVALSEDTTPTDVNATALALAEAIAAAAEPLSDEIVETVAAGADALAAAVVPPEAPTSTAPKLISASVPGVASSPRPKARPAHRPTQVSAAASAAGVAAAAGGASEIAADTIPVGTRLVQLGAFDSADVARAEWTKLAERFEDYMGEKTRVIEKASSGGKTFYRLRAMGFADLSDARRFCSVLMATKAACIPVVTR